MGLIRSDFSNLIVKMPSCGVCFKQMCEIFSAFCVLCFVLYFSFGVAFLGYSSGTSAHRPYMRSGNG